MKINLHCLYIFLVYASLIQLYKKWVLLSRYLFMQHCKLNCTIATSLSSENDIYTLENDLCYHVFLDKCKNVYVNGLYIRRKLRNGRRVCSLICTVPISARKKYIIELT